MIFFKCFISRAQLIKLPSAPVSTWRWRSNAAPGLASGYRRQSIGTLGLGRGRPSQEAKAMAPNQHLPTWKGCPRPLPLSPVEARSRLWCPTPEDPVAHFPSTVGSGCTEGRLPTKLELSV